MDTPQAPCHDLLVIGGGINGAAIARDAAGRGLSVLLCEQGDIGGATSSASSKMIHGGLRYLEHYEFRLVAEALAEREVILRIAPHLARPLSIVMPHVPGLRPVWMIRLGLFLYDTLGRWRENATLPASRKIDLHQAPFHGLLKPACRQAFVYSDVMDDDARLTLATALSAARLGADIRPRTQCIKARRDEISGQTRWHVTLKNARGESEVLARAIVNAAGPWVAEVLATCQTDATEKGLAQTQTASVRLIKGSHIVVPRLFDGEEGWLLQNDDGRVVFVLPFEEKFSLIGTTEIPVEPPVSPPVASPEEIEYLCRAAGKFFLHAPCPEDVIWHYSGLRPLYEDGHRTPGEVTRDYVLQCDGQPDQAPMLSVFGGKLTTHRRLAESALEKLGPWFSSMSPPWTDQTPLVGGDFDDFNQLHGAICQKYPALSPAWLKSLLGRHGTQAEAVLDGARSPEDLGENFGGGLFEREAVYFIRHEWAGSAEDILWRRSKTGLHMRNEERERFSLWFSRHFPDTSV